MRRSDLGFLVVIVGNLKTMTKGNSRDFSKALVMEVVSIRLRLGRNIFDETKTYKEKPMKINMGWNHILLKYNVPKKRFFLDAIMFI